MPSPNILNAMRDSIEEDPELAVLRYVGNSLVGEDGVAASLRIFLASRFAISAAATSSIVRTTFGALPKRLT